MANESRGSVKMTDAEIKEYLADNNKVQVATIGPDGTPHLTTLFYALIDDRIAFWTYGSSQKIKNLRRDPRISCLIETGVEYSELAGISLRGRASLVEDYDGIRALGEQVTKRMVGMDDPGISQELKDALLDHQATKRVGVIVEPEHVASWDHAKMAAPPGAAAITREKETPNTSEES
jgi:PPOX class probable F420-dependent enzyme